MIDYYEVLEVTREAGGDEIKRSYRRLAMDYHPDRNASHDAEEKFKELSEAYQVLSDPNKRAHYDRFGSAPAGAQGFGGFEHVDLSEALNIFMRDFGGFSGFDGIFGGREQADPRRGQDIKMTVRLTLQEVAQGAKRSIKVKTLTTCDACAGSGAAAGTNPTRCGTCSGSGEVRRAARSMFGQFVQVGPCPTCHGEGSTIGSPCEVCRGDGRIKGERTVSVDIPAGVSSQNYLTIRGQGAAGPRGGPNGDLIVMLDVKDDDRFTRDGEDLIHDLPISFSQAALGCTATIPTPWGDEPLDVPAGTQNGSEFRVRGKGLPRLGGKGVGDMHVRAHIWTPDDLNDEQRRLFADLAVHEGEAPSRKGGFWTKLKEALGA